MGYTTEFSGGFCFNKPINKKLKEYINNFSRTRHMKYDVDAIRQIPFWRAFSFNGDLGPGGCFIADCDEVIGRYNSDFIKDYNDNGICPSLWAQWVIKDNMLVWDGAEKFYNYVEWLDFYVKHFFEKNDYILNGACFWCGERPGDTGYIIIDNNIIEVYSEKFKPELLKKYKNNKQIFDMLNSGLEDIKYGLNYYEDER